MAWPRIACTLVYTPSHTEREPAPRQQKIDSQKIETRARFMKREALRRTSRGSIQEGARSIKDAARLELRSLFWWQLCHNRLSRMNLLAHGRRLLLIPILCATFLHAQALDF